MLNYESMITRQHKWMLYFLAVLVLGFAFTPYKSVFAGLLLGSIISFYNLWILQRKVNQFAESVVKKEKARGLGTISRFAAAALGIIIVLRYEGYFHIFAFIGGLMTSYVVILVDFIMFKNQGEHERRE